MASLACPGNFPQRMGEVARIASAHTGGNLAHPSLDVGEVSRPFSTPRISRASANLAPFGSPAPLLLSRPLGSRVSPQISRPLKPLMPLGSTALSLSSRLPEPLWSGVPPQISLRPSPTCPTRCPPALGPTEAARPPSPAPGSRGLDPPTHFSRAWLSEGTAEPLPPLAYMLLRTAAAAAGAPHLSGGAAGRAPCRHSYPAPRASPP